MAKDVILTLITVPDQETADRIAGTLVEEKLAACVNIIKDITSVYRWQGEICRDAELLLLVKTTQSNFEKMAINLLIYWPTI